VEGWETPDKRVLDHSIVLLCHALDSDYVSEKITKWTGDGQLNISKKLCVVEWSVVQALKYDQREVFLVRRKVGETGCAPLNARLNQSIRFEVDHLLKQYEKCRFTRKEPPIEYMMNELWSSIFPAMHERTEDFTCSTDDILKVTYDYFISWSGLQGEYSQIRKRWVEKAMKAFYEIGLARPVQNGYEISYGRRVEKNVSEYFVEKLCRMSLEASRKRPLEEALEEAQRKITEFG
jgi:hypothetical protein